MPRQSFREVIRVSGVDLSGFNLISYELTKIKGIGSTLSKAILHVSGIPENLRVGFLTDDQVKKIESTIKNLHSYVPSYLVNRNKDKETGLDIHLTGSDLKLQLDRDVSFEKKIGTWRGLRHKLGLKVRGQRTRTTGRKGRIVGVKKKTRVR